MSRAGVWEGIPLNLVPHITALETAAKELGYDARIGTKMNARGALVVALIVEPSPPRINVRESEAAGAHQAIVTTAGRRPVGMPVGT